jgi:hypothetical protein
MNERIKELMVQVCKEQGLPFTVEHNRAYMLDNFSEKFAELVVLECSYLADQAHHKAIGGKSAGGYIRQHFGVEE